MRSYLVVISAIAIAFGLCSSWSTVVVNGEQHELYEQLCQNQDVDFRRVSQAIKLIEFVKSSESLSVGCDHEIKESILDLEQALQVDDPDNYCTPDRISRITSYISKHIKVQDPTEEIPDPVAPKHMPDSLKRFFIGYSLDISKICKLGMLKLLLVDTKDVVDKDDHKEILRWVEGEDVLSKKFMNRAINYDDMFLVGNAICDSSIQTCRKLYVQSENWKKLYEMRKTCHRVFRPFYSSLILPFVRLANFGIDYQGGDIKEKLDDFREDPRLQKWAKIVFVCESLLQVVPLDLPHEEKASTFHLDEEVLKRLDQEEIDEELREQEHDDHHEHHDESEELVPLNEPCDEEDHVTTENNSNKDSSENGIQLSHGPGGSFKKIFYNNHQDNDHQHQGDEVIECHDGMKVLIKKNNNKKKPKKGGNFLTRFGKDIVKEMRKLQQERKAYLLSRKNMPITNIMLKKDIELYEESHGPIDTEDFGDKPAIEYHPKPMIHLSDDLIPPNDRRIRKAIKQYEVKKRSWKKILSKLTKKYVRLFRRVFFLGRVKFGGKNRQDLDSDELMIKLFDKSMWEKNNQELVDTTYGKFRKFMDFQNISNVATWLSMILGIVFFILGAVGVVSG